MAIYVNTFSVISRSSGRSAVACAAYRSGERLQDIRYEKEHDYANKAGVLHCEIMLPENAPYRLADRALLWNEVEQTERRKDAQLSRECLVALPHELNDDQRRDLVRGYVQSQFVDNGMIADIAIHAPGREGDERNHHAHIMLTMREVTPDGFGKKNRDWNQKPFLEHAREQWAVHTNQALERSMCEDRVDHRRIDVQRQEQQERQLEAEQQGDQEAAQLAQVQAQRLDYEPERRIPRHQFQTARKLVAEGKDIQSDRMRENWADKFHARSLKQAAQRLSVGLRERFDLLRDQVVRTADRVRRTFNIQRGDMGQLRDRQELRREGVAEYNAERQAEREAKQRALEHEQQRKAQELERQRQEREKKYEQQQRNGPSRDMGMDM